MWSHFNTTPEAGLYDGPAAKMQAGLALKIDRERRLNKKLFFIRLN
jgi:hypothetical protein